MQGNAGECRNGVYLHAHTTTYCKVSFYLKANFHVAHDKKNSRKNRDIALS